jgi:hypothetical protein
MRRNCALGNTTAGTRGKFIFTAASACTLYWLLIIIWGNPLIGTVIFNAEHNEQCIKIYQRSIVLSESKVEW